MAKESMEMRVKLTRFMKRLKNSALIGTWTRWKEFAKESVEMRVLLARCANKILNRALSGRAPHTTVLHCSAHRKQFLWDELVALVHCSARRKHLLWDESGGVSVTEPLRRKCFS